MAIALGLLATFGVEIAAGSALGTALGVISSPWAKGAVAIVKVLMRASARPLTDHEKQQVQKYRHSRTPSDIMGRW